MKQADPILCYSNLPRAHRPAWVVLCDLMVGATLIVIGVLQVTLIVVGGIARETAIRDGRPMLDGMPDPPHRRFIREGIRRILRRNEPPAVS